MDGDGDDGADAGGLMIWRSERIVIERAEKLRWKSQI